MFYLMLKLWFYRKVFGKTGYDVITSPIQKVKKGLNFLVEKKTEEMAILEILHSCASDEQDAATTTLANLDGVA